jgi:phosphocarrier protein HPr
MSQSKASRTVTVANPDGLHIRAASLIAKLTEQVPAKVELVKGNQRVDASNVLQIVSLCALEGEKILLEATGRGAHDALEALVELFENQFAENNSNKPGPGEEHHQTSGERNRPGAAAEGNPPAP